MRVTMINKYYPPHLGGIEFHMRDLARGLTDAGAQVRALVANEGRNEVAEEIDGVSVRRLPRTFAYASTPVAPSMRKVIRAEQSRHDSPDVLHLHFPYPWGEFSWLAARTDIPTVLTYHSDIVRQKKLLAAYKPVLDRVLDRVDLIIASSPNMVEHSEFLAPRADKCRVIPFGIDVDRFSATPERVQRAEELRAQHPGKPIVLFVGRFVYYKGVDVLMRAIPSVDAHFVLIGSGPIEGELREMATARGVQDRVTFLPSQPFDDLVAWFRAADVFCLPSTARSEAFGLVQIEAHASGTPVVSTDLTTGVPFANMDGVTGLTVPVGDSDALERALARLVGDDDLRTRLGAQALERARTDFTIPRMASDTLAVYDEAIALHSAGRA
ncbi:MAG: glycosyltransferase [Actinomycetota bacterium]|jgi:glycosyltransferase involved in cell wall biosynthesis|nr:glycosyltransferase [Actinomycetota bacterium]